jgi:lactate oxidase
MISSRREFVGRALGASALAMTTGTLSPKALTAAPPSDSQQGPPEFPQRKPYAAGSVDRRLDIINLYDLEAEAQKIIPNGPFGYIAGGSGDEWTLRENTRSFDDVQILPRQLAGVTNPDISTTLLGAKVASPIFIPPMAAHGLAHVSAEKGTARGATEAGVLFCTQTLANTPLEEIAKAGRGPKWFQLYYSKDAGVNRELIARAKATGHTAIVFTVDLEWPGNREGDLRTGFVFPESLPFPNLPNAKPGVTLAELTTVFKRNLDFSDIEFIRKESGLPVIVKGILTPQNAKECVKHGASAIQVSNHGGRQLDGVPAAFKALRGIVEAVGEVDKGVPVYMDGGVRRGTHVFRALAMGASAVAIGRPTLYGLSLGGWQGVKSVFDVIHEELRLTMKLAGCARLDEVTRAFVT